MRRNKQIVLLREYVKKQNGVPMIYFQLEEAVMGGKSRELEAINAQINSPGLMWSMHVSDEE